MHLDYVLGCFEDVSTLIHMASTVLKICKWSQVSQLPQRFKSKHTPHLYPGNLHLANVAFLRFPPSSTVQFGTHFFLARLIPNWTVPVSGNVAKRGGGRLRTIGSLNSHNAAQRLTSPRSWHLWWGTSHRFHGPEHKMAWDETGISSCHINLSSVDPQLRQHRPSENNGCKMALWTTEAT